MFSRIRFHASNCTEFKPGHVAILLVFLSFGPKTVLAQTVQAPFVAIQSCPFPPHWHDISLLGSDDFRLRCEAGRRLLANPIQSYDWVYRAQSSTDCEIAHSSRLLLTQLQHQLLATFAPDYQAICQSGCGIAGDQPSLVQSEKAIFRICQDDDAAATNTLLAIVQYEPSEETAFRAATELMSANRNLTPDQIDFAVLLTSPRMASRLLGIWFASHESSAEFLELWKPLTSRVLASYPHESDVLPDHVLSWLRLTGSRYRQLGLDEAADDLVNQMLRHIGQRPNDLVEMYDWLLIDEAYAAIEMLNGHCAEAIRKTPRLMFRLSEFQHRLGQWEQADKTFDQAMHAIQGDTGQGIELAMHLRSCGLERVAIELLERITANSNNPSDVTTLIAARLQARYRHDQFDDLAAATVLEQAINQIPNSTSPVNRSVDSSRKDALAELAFYRHRHFSTIGDIEQATRHLVEGLQIAPDNSELLIAAWRFSGEAAHWQESVDELVEISLQNLENRIQSVSGTRASDSREQQTVDYERVAVLNSYAWLASQTERHLETAERYARLAYSENSQSPQVMDTLASCLSARGQYVEAIAMQHRAIGLEPWNPVLQASLVRFQDVQARSQSQATNR